MSEIADMMARPKHIDDQTEYPMNLREAIEILASGREPRYRFEREFAFAMFSALLLNPEDPDAPEVGLLVAINHALSLFKRKKIKIDINSLISAYDSEFFLKRVRRDGVIVGDFHYLDYISPYDNTRYTADIVRFLLNFPIEIAGKRVRPSLGRAYCFINLERGFRGTDFGARRFWVGRSQHQIIWRRIRRCAAFEYVRFYECQLNFEIDPREDEFLFLLESEISDREQVAEFFAKALWVQKKLSGVLDKRAGSFDEIFRYLKTLKSSPCKNIEFKPTERQKCMRYSSSLLKVSIPP